jgi:subtilisin family serine protease
LAAQVSTRQVQVGMKMLRQEASTSLRPLIRFASEHNIDEAARTSFWTSKAMRMQIRKDELTQLRELPALRDVYPNRVLRVPRLVQPKEVPTAVGEVAAASWGIHRIGALAAWGAYGVRGAGVTIGILDTGIDSDHPDLKGKVTAWAEFDADGREVPGSVAHDTDKHGTHCGGTLVGGNASGQWIGVAPDAKLAAALVLDGAKGGTDAQVLAGLDWLVNQKVDVISMSLGGLVLGPEMPNTYTEAILTCLRAGIPVVTAIGNEGSQTTGSPGNDLFAYAVGATDIRERTAGFSGGRTQIIHASSFIPPEHLPLPYSKPDVSAPGVAIKSSVPNKSWEVFNGTSMATPHVAGAIALLLSATDLKRKVRATDRAFIIQDLMSGSTEEYGESGQDHRYGFGRIDVLRAIGFAKSLGY